MVEQRKQTHYYLHNRKRYENMKECCQMIGNGIPRKSFKHLLRMGLIEKIKINNDVTTDTLKPQHEEQEKTETKF